jgi:hypothetical protein
MLAKFEGSFNALTKMGADYQNRQRFTPLHGEGKPLWEFKEHDHRLYCFRTVVMPARSLHVILLSGWVKDKRGKATEEVREIRRAKVLLAEMQQLQKGGN